MQRILALDPSTAPAASKDLLNAIQKKLGMVPNLFKTLAHSPAVLQSYVRQSEALAGGSLSPALREQIALVTAGTNGCDYCASAHTLMGKGAGLKQEEMANNLRGSADNAKTQAALDFAKAIVLNRGHVTDDEIKAVRGAGYSEAELVEIIAHVSANLFTNYFNHIAKTVIDFPFVGTENVRAAA